MPQNAVASAPVSSPVRSGPRAQTTYRPVVLDYIGRELRRIGAVGITALAVLVALSIVVL
jgi:hypothetical protein